MQDGNYTVASAPGQEEDMGAVVIFKQSGEAGAWQVTGFESLNRSGSNCSPKDRFMEAPKAECSLTVAGRCAALVLAGAPDLDLGGVVEGQGGLLRVPGEQDHERG